MFSVWKSNLTLSFVAASSEPMYSNIKDKKSLTEIKLKYITASSFNNIHPILCIVYCIILTLIQYCQIYFSMLVLLYQDSTKSSCIFKFLNWCNKVNKYYYCHLQCFWNICYLSLWWSKRRTWWDRRALVPRQPSPSSPRWRERWILKKQKTEFKYWLILIYLTSISIVQFNENNILTFKSIFTVP